MLLLSLSCRDNEVMGFRVLIFCSLWWWGHYAHHYFAPIKKALNVKSKLGYPTFGVRGHIPPSKRESRYSRCNTTL
jgi:hypothetical protein